MKPNNKDNSQKNAPLTSPFQGYSVKKPMPDPNEPPSKTKLKADADAQQALGVKLVDLPKDKLAKLGLPENLLDAIHEAKRLTANGAIRRQKQYIGSLMRDIETADIEEQLQKWEGKHTEENAHFHQLENWRNRLISTSISDTNVLNEFMQLHPNTDSQQLRTLIRNAQRELASNKPAKSSRELFKLLRTIIENDQAGDVSVSIENNII